MKNWMIIAVLTSCVFAFAEKGGGPDQETKEQFIKRVEKNTQKRGEQLDKKTIETKRTDKHALGRTFETRQQDNADDLLLRMNHIIRPLKGKILTKEYHRDNHRLTAIHVQIPAENYASFCRGLNRLATFKTPPPALSDEGLETVKLLINLTYPE